MNDTKKCLSLLIKRIKRDKKIRKKLHKGKIFRYNTKGMYLRNKIRVKLDEFKQFVQRGKNGYSYVDVYSIKDWFLDNIVNLLHDMILDLHSYPVRLGEHITYEEWHQILLTMYECFKQANENTCDEKYVNDYEYRKEMLHDGLNLFVKYFEDLWD